MTFGGIYDIIILPKGTETNIPKENKSKKFFKKVLTMFPRYDIISISKGVRKEKKGSKIMTKREFLMDVIATVEKGELLVTAQAMKEYAEKEIQKLDERNANRSSKPTKKQVENGVLKYKILEVLDMEKPTIAAEIGEKVGISTQKASSLCTQLRLDNFIYSVDVKIPKKGTVKGYCLVNPETEEVEEVEEVEEMEE